MTKANKQESINQSHFQQGANYCTGYTEEQEGQIYQL